MTEYDSRESLRCPYKKKDGTGVLTSRNTITNYLQNGGTQSYCALWKKTATPKCKYMLYSFVIWFGKRSDQAYFKEGLGGNLGIRHKAINRFWKVEKKRKSELKYLKKQKIYIYNVQVHQILLGGLEDKEYPLQCDEEIWVL